jgi:hypothetical protein
LLALESQPLDKKYRGRPRELTRAITDTGKELRLFIAVKRTPSCAEMAETRERFAAVGGRDQTESSRNNRRKSLVAEPCFFPRNPGNGSELGGGDATKADPA